MEAPQMRGVEEPLLPEPRAVEGGATQSEGAIETQEARYPRLHKTAGLRSLDVWVEISNSPEIGAELVNRDGKLRVHQEAGARLSRVMGKGKRETWAPAALFISHIVLLSRQQVTDSLTDPSSASA